MAQRQKGFAAAPLTICFTKLCHLWTEPPCFFAMRPAAAALVYATVGGPMIPVRLMPSTKTASAAGTHLPSFVCLDVGSTFGSRVSTKVPTGLPRLLGS